MKSILIIDDDEFILFGLSKAFSVLACSEVLTARHGRQAVEILDSRPVDLIVTDIKMPVMNGYEVVDYANKHYPCVPVYVMTGDYLPDIMPKFRAASVSRFVSKPFSFRQVAEEIMSRLGMAEQAAPAQA